MPYRLHEPYGGLVMGNWDGERLCPHTPEQTYTRYPCSCGRELWPPRGRGRGESLLSPRRIAAKLKALDALELRGKGYSYRVIAATLGYRTTSGAWQAVQRIYDQEAASHCRDRGGARRRRHRWRTPGGQYRTSAATARAPCAPQKCLVLIRKQVSSSGSDNTAGSRRMKEDEDAAKGTA